MPAQPGSTGAPMARRILSLLLALLGGCDCTCSTGKGLRGWLCAAHVDLEELDIQDVGGFNLKISSIQCSGFEVGMLRSGTSAAVPASTGRSNASLTVDVDAFSFDCTIERLDAKQTSFPYLEPVGSGRLVVRGAKLDAGLVTQMAGQVPLSINVSASTQLRVDASQVELSLSGNVWMKLINAIKPLLISTVIEMLPSIVKDLRHDIDDTLATLLANLTAYSDQTLPPEPPEPALAPGLVNLSSSEALHGLDFVLNSVMGPDGPLGLNPIVQLLTNGTGALQLDVASVLPAISIPVPSLGNLTLAIRAVNGSDLEAVRSLALLTPNASEPLTLRLGAGVRPLTVGFRAELTVTPGAGAISSFPLVERLGFTAGLGSTDVAGALVLALNRSALDSVGVAEVLDLPCLLARTVVYASVRSLRLSTRIAVVDVRPIREEALEDELDAVIDDVADFALLLLGEAVLPRTLSLLVAGPLREAAEGLLQQLLPNATNTAACLPVPPRPPPLPPAPPIDPHIVDWRDSEALQLLNRLLTVVPAGVDDLIDVLTHNTGRLSLSLPPQLVPLGPLGMLHVSLPNVTVGGLDSISEMELLKPIAADGAGLLAGVSLGLLSVEVRVELRVTSPAGGDAGSAAKWPAEWAFWAAADPSLGPTPGHRDALLSADGGGWAGRRTGGPPRAARALAAGGVRWGEAHASTSGSVGPAAGWDALRFTLRASLRNMSVGAAARLMINGTGLSAVEVAQALSVNGSACFAQQLVYAGLSSLGAALVVESVEVDGGLAPATLRDTPLRLALGRSLEDVLMRAVNQRIASALEPMWSTACPARVPPRPGLIDFRGGGFGARAVARAHQAIDAFGAAGLDRLVDRFTPRAQPGQLRLPRLLELRWVDQMLGPVWVRVEDVRLSGLDSFFSLDALRPDAADGRILRHDLGFGANASLLLELTARLRFGNRPEHALRLGGALRRTVAELGTRLLVDGGTMGAITMAELRDSWGDCLLCSLRAVSLTGDSALRALPSGSFTLSLQPLDRGAHPRPAARLSATTVDPQLGQAVLHLANGGLASLVRRAHRGCPGAPPTPSPPAPLPADDLRPVGVGLVSGTSLVLVVLFGLGGTACIRRRRWLGHLRASLRASLLDGHVAPSLPCDGAGDVPAARGSQPFPAAGGGSPRPWDVEHDPLAARFGGWLAQVGVPLLIGCNVVVFVLGNALPGAKVVVTLTLAGEPIQLPPIKTFSLVNTVRDMWRAEAYVLCVLIAFLSGVWPYLKLGLMLLAWWLPGTYLSSRWRQRMLRAVDSLGKWSALDTLMLVIFTVAFHIVYDLPSSPADGPAAAPGPRLPGSSPASLALGPSSSSASISSTDGGEPPSVAAVLSEVVPGPGVYLFTSGVCLSLAISALLVRMQRVAGAVPDVAADGHDHTSDGDRVRSGAGAGGVDAFAPVEAAEVGPVGTGAGVGGGAGTGGLATRRQVRRRPHKALCDYRFARLLGRHDVSLPRWLRRLILLAPLMCGALLTFACTVDTFSLEVVGLAGQLIGPDDARHRWSVVSIARLLPTASPMAGPGPMRLIQLLFILFIVGLPLLFLLALTLLWALPLSAAAQQRLLFAAEVLHSWSIPDVFVLTIIASSLELDRFAHFVLGGECDAMSRLATTYLADLVADPAEGCAGIGVHILPGAALFVLAVLLWNAIGTFIMHAANAAVPLGSDRGVGTRGTRALFADSAR